MFYFLIFIYSSNIKYYIIFMLGYYIYEYLKCMFRVFNIYEY